MTKTRGRIRGKLTTPLLGLVLASAVVSGTALTACSSGDGGTGLGVTLEDGDIVLAGDVADGTPVVDLYEDYSCHYCADLAEADTASLRDALDNDKLTMRFNTVNFLDGGEDGHSTLAGAVALAIADTGDVDAFWQYHDRAFLQYRDIIDWTLDDFAGLAEELGVDAGTVDAIRDGSVVTTYRPALELNFVELKDRLGGQAGTPSVFVDGTQLQMKKDPADPTKMADWVPDVVGR
ncbi:thioredoxin domain-containing protein [uncultured Corynebacterium sp.]|uniref:DsbA family protein n=1 Tax=uncultured Corynebacterium sp. TaxID=159447 RepID=UPI0025EAFA61|nr:thioredoxin domain-containing protein [uncultured Corynebacterium sp.]